MKEVWREIRESLDIGRFVGSFRERWVWLAFLLGGIGLAACPHCGVWHSRP